jgi:hypothetical protein
VVDGVELIKLNVILSSYLLPELLADTVGPTVSTTVRTVLVSTCSWLKTSNHDDDDSNLTGGVPSILPYNFIKVC